MDARVVYAADKVEASPECISHLRDEPYCRVGRSPCSCPVSGRKQEKSTATGYQNLIPWCMAMAVAGMHMC